MEKRAIFLFLTLCMLILSGCTRQSTNTGDNEGTSYSDGKENVLAEVSQDEEFREFLEAVLESNFDVIEQYVDKYKNTATLSGQYPLQLAIEKKNYDVIEYLLENGANPNIYTEHYGLALRCAIENGDFQSAKLLFDYGASVYAEDNDERTLYETIVYKVTAPLGYMKRYGATDYVAGKNLPEEAQILKAMVEKEPSLLEEKLDTNYFDFESPLAIALYNHNMFMVDELIRMGYRASNFSENDQYAIDVVEEEVRDEHGLPGNGFTSLCIIDQNEPGIVNIDGNFNNCEVALYRYKQYRIADWDPHFNDVEEDSTQVSEETSKRKDRTSFIKNKQMEKLLSKHSFMKKGILSTDRYESALKKAGASDGSGSYFGGTCSWYKNFTICADELDQEKIVAVTLTINYALTVSELEEAVNENINISSGMDEDDYGASLALDGQEYIISTNGDSSDSLITEILIKNLE